jgi:hypothetical protein
MQLRVSLAQPFHVPECTLAEISACFVSVKGSAGMNIVDCEAECGLLSRQ